MAKPTKPKVGSPKISVSKKKAKQETAMLETVLVWEVDPVATIAPHAPIGDATPISVPIRSLDDATFPLTIIESAPALEQDTAAHRRYWTAVEALGRGAHFWSECCKELLPAGRSWNECAGARLKVTLNGGDDFNAFYDRDGLNFETGPVGESMVYVGESPDVLCHELGHAVLDVLCPELWHAASIEAAAFHESFGDISAILCALQLPSVRQQVLADTRGHLYRTSRLSRFAEQLGWAIRQSQPDRAESDCLRNAVNSFFYRDPSQLPPSGPASILSSEPHNFARVFTGGFFEAFGLMFRSQSNDLADDKKSAVLEQISHDAGQLLVKAIMATPVVPSYYSQLAAALLRADQELFEGRYNHNLTTGFNRHGILAPEAVSSLSTPAAPPQTAVAASEDGAESARQLPPMPIACAEYGLNLDTLLVHSASQLEIYPVSGAAHNTGSLKRQSHDEAAKSFVEDLVRQGRVDLQSIMDAGELKNHPLHDTHTTKTHETCRHENGIILKRLRFNCGFSND